MTDPIEIEGWKLILTSHDDEGNITEIHLSKDGHKNQKFILKGNTDNFKPMSRSSIEHEPTEHMKKFGKRSKPHNVYGYDMNEEIVKE